PTSTRRQPMPHPFLDCSQEEPLNHQWPSQFSAKQAAGIVGVALSQWQNWQKLGLIEPTERGEHGTQYYSRPALLIGSILRVLQGTLGQNSAIPADIIREINSRGLCPTFDRPADGAPRDVCVIGLQRDGLRVFIHVDRQIVDELIIMLDALSDAP